MVVTDNSKNLGPANFVSSNGLASTYILTTLTKTLNVASPLTHAITATFSETGYASSSNALPGGQTVTPAPLTIAALANTKTYDSTTSAAATPTVSGLVAGDSMSALTEVYSNKNAGSTKTLSVCAYTINDGNGGNNYTVTTLNSNIGIINPALLTIAAKTNTKTYNATIAAAAVPAVSGLFGNDSVSSGIEVYGDANAGIGKTLNVALYFVNDGNSGNNYSVTTVANSSGVINKANLTLTAKTNTKTYDSTTTAAAIPSVNGLAGHDTVTGLAEAYTSANASDATIYRTVSSGAIGMVFDPSGNLYVSSLNASTVYKFAPGATTSSIILSVFDAWAMACDAGGNLYVASYENNSQNNSAVTRFGPGGTSITGSLLVGLQPVAMIFDSSGNLYVACKGSNSVYIFAPAPSLPRRYLPICRVLRVWPSMPAATCTSPVLVIQRWLSSPRARRRQVKLSRLG